MDSSYWLVFALVAIPFYSCACLFIYIDEHFSFRVSISEIFGKSITRFVVFMTIVCIFIVLLPFDGNLSVFFFIAAISTFLPFKILQKIWQGFLPGKSHYLLPVFAMLFFATGLFFMPDEWKKRAESNYSSPMPSSSPVSSPTPRPIFAPTPRPTFAPTPTPAPAQSYSDGPGISFEDFMQGFEEYKQNGGKTGISYEEFMEGFYQLYPERRPQETSSGSANTPNSSSSEASTWGEESATDELTGALSVTAYWTPSGKSYHFSASCPSLSHSKTIYSGTLQDALYAGKTDPCNNCAGGS